MPRKIRELIKNLESSGYAQIVSSKGSHRKFVHPDVLGAITVSEKSGADAKPYQEKQIQIAIEQTK